MIFPFMGFHSNTNPKKPVIFLLRNVAGRGLGSIVMYVTLCRRHSPRSRPFRDCAV